MTPGPTWRGSFLVAGLLGLASGAAVALVLQDVSVMIPFVAAIPIGAPAIHGLRNLATSTLQRLGLVASVAGVAAIAYGYFISDDGTTQALGVLGGTAVASAGLLATAMVTVARMRSRRRSDSGTTAESWGAAR